MAEAETAVMREEAAMQHKATGAREVMVVPEEAVLA